MTKRSRNGGINITGSTISGDNVLIGLEVKATITAAHRNLSERGLSQLAAKLDELIAAVDRESANAAKPAEVRENARAVAAELARPKPDSSRLRGLLDGITAAAGSMGAIVGAAKGILSLLP